MFAVRPICVHNSIFKMSGASPEVFIIHKPNWCILMANYFRHKAPCGIRKLTAAFVSKRGVFSRFSWSLDFGAKMAEFPLPVPQIWRSWKRVTIQIQLMNIHVSECKYYCLHLVPKFGDECDRQNWRLHPTANSASSTSQVALERSITLPCFDGWRPDHDITITGEVHEGNKSLDWK